MFDRSIGLLASCALGASAFLLPPTIAVENRESSSILVNDGKTTRFSFPCPSCDFPYNSQDNITGQIVNKLVIDFAIEEDGTGLLANGLGIFPHSKYDKEDPWYSLTQAWFDQIPADTTEKQISQGDYPKVPLRISLAGIVENKPTTTIDYKLHSIQWKISGLNAKTMTDVPMIFIQLLETEQGELLLLSVDISPSEALPFAKTSEDKPFVFEILPFEPSMLEKPHPRPCRLPGPFCAFGKFIGDKFGSPHRRPCPGRKMDFDGEHLPTHIRPHFGVPDIMADGEAPPMPPPGEDHWRPHHGHHHGHRRHGFFHIVSRGMLAVLLPIMAGITVGIIVSVLGLLFGRLLGYLWFTAFRGGRRGYASVAAVEEGFPVDVKEDTQAESEQPLPPYEDAPAYEDAVPQQKSDS